MWKKKLSFMLLIPMLIGLNSSASGQVVVEDATVIWEKDIDGGVFPDIPPRIILEYATTISKIPLAAPPDFEIPRRIIVEYATGITQFGLVKFPACECDLNHDHSCNITDWPYFIEDWGRIDCNDPGVNCECDLNGDGRCNILDWPYFIEDWGRTDCAIYH